VATHRPFAADELQNHLDGPRIRATIEDEVRKNAGGLPARVLWNWSLTVLIGFLVIYLLSLWMG
jgi:hypothetical protein